MSTHVNEIDVDRVEDFSCYLGEGVLWNSTTQRYCFVDIIRRHVYEYDPITRYHQRFTLPGDVGSLAFRANDRRSLIVALDRSVGTLDLTSGTFSKILDSPEAFSHPENRFNDGKCDPLGRFVVGTMNRPVRDASGSLYAIERKSTTEAEGYESHSILQQVTISNGIGWTSDGTRMFYIDSPTRTVCAIPYDATTGMIADDHLRAAQSADSRLAAYSLIKFSDTDGVPDGMTMDERGHLWVAHWSGSCVTEHDPQTGAELRRVAIPARQVTTCSFGGANLDELVVTTAREGIDSEEVRLRTDPNAGHVYRVRGLGIRGVPERHCSL